MSVNGKSNHVDMEAHPLHLELVFKQHLTLVQPAESVDLVLVLSADLDLLSAGRGLVLFGELRDNT